MRRWAVRGVFLLVVIQASAASAREELPAQVGESSRLTNQEMEILLSRDMRIEQREPLLTKLVANAQAGDGSAAFQLGALYRSGRDHPARLVDRDLDTARYWLEKCVEAKECPLWALASLAELGLAAGDAKAAMQWAQAWVVLERELDSRSRAGDRYRQGKYAAYKHTSYQAYLLKRCYDAMPGTTDPDAQGMAWFNELRARKGAQLDRMFFRTIDRLEAPASGQDLQISAQNQRSQAVYGNVMQPSDPAFGLYLYKGDPEGGPAERVRLIEAWPTPKAAHGLDLLARQVRMKPYESDGPRYTELPISYNVWDYSLVPEK